MGPNGCGKSTLAAVLAGRDGYDVTGGEVIYNGHDLLDLDPRNAPAKGCSSRSSIRSKFPA